MINNCYFFTILFNHYSRSLLLAKTVFCKSMHVMPSTSLIVSLDCTEWLTYTAWVCLSIRCDGPTMTKSPTYTFLRTYSTVKWWLTVHCQLINRRFLQKEHKNCGTICSVWNISLNRKVLMPFWNKIKIVNIVVSLRIKIQNNYHYLNGRKPLGAGHILHPLSTVSLF